MLEVVSARAELTTCAIHSSAVARFGPAHSVAHSTRSYTVESRVELRPSRCSVLFCSVLLVVVVAASSLLQLPQVTIKSGAIRSKQNSCATRHISCTFSPFSHRIWIFATSFRFEASANFTTLLYLSKRFQQHKHVLVLHSVLHAEVWAHCLLLPPLSTYSIHCA